MLAVVQLHARLGIDERKRPPAQVISALNQGDGDAAVGEGAGGRQARQPPADYHAVDTRSIGT